jgi:ABC-type oligopeptide transport system ATPase subunit
LSSLKSQSFENHYQSCYNELFVDLKSNAQNISQDFIDNIFVKTYSYKEVKNQKTFFVIGRKGSGKSTISELIEKLNHSRYKGRIVITADKINLSALYALYNTDRIHSDTINAITKLACFRFAWELFFIICCMEILINLDAVNDLSGFQQEKIRSIRKKITDLKSPWASNSDNQGAYNAYFFLSFSAVFDFFEYCVGESRSTQNYFFSDIQGLFNNRSRFLNFVLGETVVNDFYEILTKCRKKFLITLDGFDTSFDTFRRDNVHNPSDLNKIVEFEIEWLRSLLLLVLDIQSNNDPKNHLYNLIDFCITVPKDRFYEVKKSERDSYRYHNRYSTLDWSGIELAILLRKRLERLSKCKTDKGLRPAERLDSILRDHFNHIPANISLDFNGMSYKVPLFMYILRHSSWRPREILLYYVTIIAVSKDLKDKRRKVTPEIIRRAIKETTPKIIESEFINEFETIINIREIINSFTNQRQYLSFAEVKLILDRSNFKLVSIHKDDVTTEQKIEFLYEIGFIGYLVTPKIKEEWKINFNHAFYFNERDTIFQGYSERRYHEFTFIIHPMFTEYLQIDTSGHELVLEFTWDYLYDMESWFFN